MNITRHVLLPVVAAGTLLAGGVGVASANQWSPATVSTVVAKQGLKAADPSAICARVAAATKPHPVLKELCGLYADASLSPAAHASIGKVIVQLTHRHRHAANPAVTPTATASPSGS